MERFARLVMRHRRLVFAAWALALRCRRPGRWAAVRSAEPRLLAARTTGRHGRAPPGPRLRRDSYDTFVATVTVPEGQTVQGNRAAIGKVFAAPPASALPGRVVDYSSTGDKGFTDRRRPDHVALIQSRSQRRSTRTPAVDARPAAGGSGGRLHRWPHGVRAAVGRRRQRRAERARGDAARCAGALVVLGSSSPRCWRFVPLLIAAVSILTTFLIVLRLTTFTDVSFVVQFLIALVGLGVAIDYSLLVVSRWREEIAHGHDNQDAVASRCGPPGHAVVRLRCHGRDQPDRAGRHPGASAAQHGLRRHAHPAVQRRGRAHPAAGAAVASVRAWTSPRSARRARVPRLDGVGPDDRQARRGRRGGADRARDPDRADPPPVRPVQHRVQGTTARPTRRCRP